jgi:hypothetical protein
LFSIQIQMMWSYDFGPAPDRPHGPIHGADVDVVEVAAAATDEVVTNDVSVTAEELDTAVVFAGADASGVALEHAAITSRAQQVRAERLM